MKIYFVCPMVQWRPNHWRPAIEDIRVSGGAFPCVWIPTRAERARKFCVGMADVNATQLAAVAADPRIHAVAEANWARALDSVDHTALDAFVASNELEALKTGEDIRAFVHRLAIAARPGHDGLPDLARRLLTNFGVP